MINLNPDPHPHHHPHPHANRNRLYCRYDLYRDLFELGPNGSVHGADINAKFDLGDSFKGNYRLRVRGPGMLGDYLEEGDGAEALVSDGGPYERCYLLGADKAMPCVVGMKPKSE